MQPIMPESNTPNNKLRQRLLQIDVVNHTDLVADELGVETAVRTVLNQFRIPQAEISVALVDDATIRKLNVQYLQHDYETDVLSFPLSPPDADVLVGEIIASVDTANRVSEELGCPPLQELLLYVIHGTLHLVGLSDEDTESAQQMRQWEHAILSELGYNPISEQSDDLDADVS
jgi:probable rRNA maturation factor